MDTCIFCKIVNHQMPAKIIFEDEQILAFHDINPQAPVHILVIPKLHISKVSDITLKDRELVGKIIFQATELARNFKIDQSGFRLVFNNGREGGQAVYHIHLHLLGGRSMGWPPG
jgi:histidine triad (HIT) family protein